MSVPHEFLKRYSLLTLIAVILVSSAFLNTAYSQSKSGPGDSGKEDSATLERKVRVSAVDLIRGEIMIRRAGAREALGFFESLTRVPVDDERKGFVYFRMAKIHYARGNYQRAYERIESAVPLLQAPYNLFSAMSLRLDIFTEMGWFREAKQIAGFLVDSGFVGVDEVEMYLFMADADARLENAMDAALHYEKAYVLGDYWKRVEIYKVAADRLRELFEGIANPGVFRDIYEGARTLHFRTLISYLAATRSYEEKMFGFSRYFLGKYLANAEFTGEKERGLEIEEKLLEGREDKPVIAVYLPFTGDLADYGFNVLSGLELGLRKRSSPAERGGHPFYIEIHDTGGDPSLLGRHLDLGVIDRDTIAIVGPLTSNEGFFVASRYDAPLLFYLGQKYIDRGSGLVNFGLKPSQEAMKLVNFAFSSGVFRAALLYPDNGYGRAYRNEVLEASRVQGIDIVLDRGYPPETEDFQWFVREIVGGENFEEYAGVEEKEVSMPVGFDGVFVLDVPERGVFLHSQMSYYNVKVPYFVFSSWAKAPFLRDAKRDVKNVYCVTDFNPFSPLKDVRDFVVPFERLYGKPPDRFAGYGFDLALLFDSYVGRVSMLGLNYSEMREGLKKELYEVRRHTGVSGTVEFTSGSRAVRKLTLLHIDQGKVKEVFLPLY